MCEICDTGTHMRCIRFSSEKTGVTGSDHPPDLEPHMVLTLCIPPLPDRRLRWAGGADGRFVCLEGGLARWGDPAGEGAGRVSNG
jgi:hypothetical protein